MSKAGPVHLHLLPFFCLGLGGPGCSDADGVGSAGDSFSSTGEPSATSGSPTTGAGGAPTTGTEATPTTGTGAPDPETGTTGTEVSTGEILGCGDGIIDPGEACDDGIEGNGDSRYCKEDCTLNVCGDGDLLIGWELCDEGAGNSAEYGSPCSSQCTPGKFCGDHIVQEPFETCDLGPGNGGMKGDEQGILCDPSCRAQQLRGFVTSAAFTGDLGGLFGADLKCRDAALAAGLPEPERFHALLSSGSVAAKTRFKAVAASLPYVLVTGKKFADNFAALLATGPLGEGIAATETGALLYQVYVASNTAPGGERFSPDQHCQDWTSADAAFKAWIGIGAVPLDAPEWAQWQDTQAWIGTMSVHCDKQELHLYCLEI